MNDLLLHNKTSSNIQNILNRPPHALLITAPDGSGKDTIAQRIASGVLSIQADKLSAHPYYLLIDPSDNTIKIDEIRELQQFLKLRVPSHRAGINRVIIIAKAERMRAEAQNALLKTLEEPPADTMLILTTEAAENLLITIVSRCQELSILPVAYDQAKDYFAGKGISEAKILPAYALSLGQVGLMHALLNNETHPLKNSVHEAKQLLALSTGERLLQVDKISKDKEYISQLLNALSRISHAAVNAAVKKGAVSNAKQWSNRQNTILSATEDFKKNANTKLLLSDLLISL